MFLSAHTNPTGEAQSNSCKTRVVFLGAFWTYYKLCNHSSHYASLNWCFLLENRIFGYLMRHKDTAIQFVIVSLLV